MKLHSLIFWVPLFLAISCAHHSKLTPSELTEADIAHINEEALKLASGRLDSLITKAKSEGPASVNYLATGLFLKGNAAFMEGDYSTSSVLLRHLTRLTDDAFVHKKYAVALIRLGEMAEAGQVLQKIYDEQKGSDESVALILAGVYAAMEKLPESQKVYRQVLMKNPRQEDACLFLGKSLAMEKKWNEAKAHLEGCQKRIPSSGVFSYYLGKVFVERGDLKTALQYFRSSNQREPGSTQSVVAMGLILEQMEKTDEAIAAYRNHLKLKPHDQLVLQRFVQALFMKEKFAEVIPYAERLVDADPEDLNMKVRLGILYTDAHDYDKAISVFNELLQVAPQSDKILYYLGAIHQELHRFELAIDYFSRIPTSSGLYQDSSYQMATMLNTLAQMEYLEGKDERLFSEQFLKLVDNKTKELPQLKLELGVLKAGYFESTERDLDAIAALKSVSDDKEFQLQHQYYLAGLLEKVKDYDAATAVITAILDKDPKNAHAWNFLGYSILERGNPPEEAFTYIQKAVALAPEDGYIQDSLGWYYFKIGRPQEALKEVTKAFKKIPDDAIIAKHLALIHKNLKNYSEARTYVQHALKNTRLSSERKDLLGVLELIERERSPASVQQD